MANEAPIGLFDSGVGGLSVMREIRRLLPAEDMVYFADSAHCPYGQKTPEEVRERTFAICDFLLSLGSKMIVVACNTASIAALDAMRERFPLPIVGMEPGVKPAISISRTGKIGVLATGITLTGQRFNSLVERFAGGVEVFTQPCPGLVELVETGLTEGPKVEEALISFLKPMLDFGVDTIVLGCTHYPFLRGAIQSLTGPSIQLVDTGEAVARQTKRLLESLGEAASPGRLGREIFFTSGPVEAVEPVMGRLWRDESVAVRYEPAPSRPA